MKRQGTIILSTGVIVAVSVGILILLQHSAKRSRQRIISCTGNLFQVGMAYKTYAADHAEEYPKQLADLAPYLAHQPGPFWCPAQKLGRPGPMDTVSEWNAYVYIRGRRADDPPDCVLAYCNSGAHGRDLTTVLFVDGHTKRMTWRELANHMAEVENRRLQHGAAPYRR